MTKRINNIDSFYPPFRNAFIHLLAMFLLQPLLDLFGRIVEVYILKVIDLEFFKLDDWLLSAF